MRTAIEVFCFEGDARAGCSSRLFGGEAEKQTGYGFQPVDDRLTWQNYRRNSRQSPQKPAKNI